MRSLSTQESTQETVPSPPQTRTCVRGTCSNRRSSLSGPPCARSHTWRGLSSSRNSCMSCAPLLPPLFRLMKTRRGDTCSGTLKCHMGSKTCGKADDDDEEEEEEGRAEAAASPSMMACTSVSVSGVAAADDSNDVEADVGEEEDEVLPRVDRRVSELARLSLLPEEPNDDDDKDDEDDGGEGDDDDDDDDERAVISSASVSPPIILPFRDCPIPPPPPAVAAAAVLVLLVCSLALEGRARARDRDSRLKAFSTKREVVTLRHRQSTAVSGKKQNAE